MTKTLNRPYRKKGRARGDNPQLLRNERIRAELRPAIAKEFTRRGGELIRIGSTGISIGIVCHGRAFGHPVLLPITSTELIKARCTPQAVGAIVAQRLEQLRKLREASDAAGEVAAGEGINGRPAAQQSDGRRVGEDREGAGAA